MNVEIANKIKYLELVGKLKHLPRTGWVLRNVKDPETVSGHMYRMAMMMFLIEDNDIDKSRCMEMALVHDLAESIIGDFTPYCGISPEEKYKRECEAMKEIGELVGKNGDYINTLFLEFEEQKTKEAKLIKEFDLFDMALQAYEYEKKEKAPGRLQEFIDSTSNRFSHPLICKLYSEILKNREIEISGQQIGS
ncbi:5'-deoxynucleotidase HDDC2 isoform X2 [Halyomorpha halys]|uniref:5'-deoxynucleotidase HDDC2 isoform X2 n=1 Tax=Halyomorpha halys TaxID=286706 RepID=UPI0006D51FC1|nr:HD domain-containing protein 2 isoform X2 [Halyomorpha halys]